jgi:hypothetical protein
VLTCVGNKGIGDNSIGDRGVRAKAIGSIRGEDKDKETIIIIVARVVIIAIVLRAKFISLVVITKALAIVIRVRGDIIDIIVMLFLISKYRGLIARLF